MTQHLEASHLVPALTKCLTEHYTHFCSPKTYLIPCTLTGVQRQEEFFVCKWTVDAASGAPLLLLAGKNSVLRVVDVAHETLIWVFDPINPPAHVLRFDSI